MMRVPMIFALLFVSALGLAGCSGSGTNTPEAALSAAPSGSLDGANIALQVTATGGTVMLPCYSTGMFRGPLTLDNSGHFSVPGTVVAGTLTSPPATPFPVQFTETTDGKTMTLTVPLSNALRTPETYSLAYGAPSTQTGTCPG